MKRILAVALLVACAGSFWVYKHKEQIWQTELVLTQEEAQWLEYRLQLQTKIQNIEHRLEILRARYNSIPEGSLYHRPWANLGDIKACLKRYEKDPKFAQTDKCQRLDEDTKPFCRAYSRLKADEHRWYTLADLSVQIRALEQELLETNIEVIRADDPAKVALKQNLMKYVRGA